MTTQETLLALHRRLVQETQGQPAHEESRELYQEVKRALTRSSPISKQSKTDLEGLAKRENQRN